MIDALYGLLNSIGFTDPLHALIVHMPMGLVIGAFLLVLIAIIFKRTKLFLTARHISIMAFVFVFPTILFGFFDWLHFFKGAMIPAIRYKIILAAAVTVILAVGIVVGRGVRVRTVTTAVIAALAFVAAVGLGYFGGSLVYGSWAKGSRTASADARPSANPEGEKVFLEHCAACHESGGNTVDPRFPLKGSPYLGSIGEFTGFIRAPRRQDRADPTMPAFSASEISDGQARDLYGYVREMSQAWR
jgi:mono/diheme cytochrome c family protein